MRRLGGVLVVALAAAGSFSCRRPPLPVRIAVHSAPQSFDPHLQNEILTTAVLANIYDSLTEFDEESQIRPALAATWTNPDDRTWVFRLRPGVRFHDGRSLTAEDVAFSLGRARNHPRTELSSYLVEVESFKVLDPLTVEIRTRRPFAALLVKLSPIQIVPSGSPETITGPVGTGSYRLLRYEEGKSIELVPAPTDWRGPAEKGPLTFVVEREPRKRLDKLLAGEVEVAAGLSEDAVNVLRGSAGCRAVVRPGFIVEYLQLAFIDPRFRDRRVRQAFDLAIDRSAYVAEAHHGLGQPVDQLVVPGVFGYAPDLKPATRD
ncbi:MAG TPA: ABC transporter substrate-binding protein, partial [Thermoanaerobaculia bacterium]|nr:ABC transporter substrate-binding protein [Thermoanaerobaculia bacterium]